MDKKEYIVNQLKRTFNKKYENYCITRIYHLLNRLDVKIVTQQLFLCARSYSGYTCKIIGNILTHMQT